MQKVFRGGFYPANRIMGSALSAIDMALWDIKGKRLKAPVFELLGGLCRDYVDCYIHAVENYGENMKSPINDSEIVDVGKRSVAELGTKFIRLVPSSHGNEFDSRKEIVKLLKTLKTVREQLGRKSKS